MSLLSRIVPCFEACGGVADVAGYGGFRAAGNRVVLSTISSLVCIGDPSVPYDWNPGSRGKMRRAPRCEYW